MQISQLMTQTVSSVGPETTLPVIAREMRDKNLGAVPVIADNRLVGMVTDRDIIVRALANSCKPDAVTAADVMTEGVLYCYADEAPEDVLHNMSRAHIRRLPVYDRDRQLVGMISIDDLARHTPADQAGRALRRLVSN